MAKNRDTTKAFKKGGYKTKTRPSNVSRQGLPKIYPPHVNMTLQMIKPKI